MCGAYCDAPHWVHLNVTDIPPSGSFVLSNMTFGACLNLSTPTCNLPLPAYQEEALATNIYCSVCRRSHVGVAWTQTRLAVLR